MMCQFSTSTSPPPTVIQEHITSTPLPQLNSAEIPHSHHPSPVTLIHLKKINHRGIVCLQAMLNVFLPHWIRININVTSQ